MGFLIGERIWDRVGHGECGLSSRKRQPSLRRMFQKRLKPLIPSTDDRLATWVTGILTLGVYLASLAPSVVGGDAGELIAGTASGGVLHPPGYPLYALLGKLFLGFPWGEPALRMNVFSAVCGVAAAVMLQRATARWSGSPWAGVLAAAGFAFSPVVWEHAVGAEVFALHHGFVAALLWLAVAYGETGAPRWIWIGAGVSALGMSHHHTLVFFAVPLALWPLIRQPSYWLKPKRIFALAGIGLLGLLPYAWLPAASASAAPVSWGDWTTLEGAWRHFTRADYGTLQLASGEVAQSGGWGSRLAAWAVFQSSSVAGLGLVLAGIGLWKSGRGGPGRTLAIASLAVLVFYILVFNWLANLSPADPLMLSVLSRFWTSPHLLVCAWMGLGWAVVSRRSRTLAICGALIFTAMIAVPSWNKAERRNAREFSDYGAAWIETLPPGAVLLARGDLIVNTIGYRQVCTGLRKDVRLLDLERMTYAWHTKSLHRSQPDLKLPGERYHPTAPGCYPLASLFAANPGLGPWFVAGDLTPAEIAGLPGWSLRPHGMGWRLAPPGETLDFGKWWAESEEALPGFPPPVADRRAVDPWAAAVANDHLEASNRRGVFALDLAAANQNSPGILRKAVGVFESMAAQPGAPARVFKNLGLAWQRLEGRDPNARAKAREAWQRFLTLDGGKDKDSAAIRQWLQAP